MVTARERKEIENAWRKFDRSTAFHCRNANREFDIEKCREAWKEYCGTLDAFGIPAPPTPLGL